jgi:DNA-binding beta-propeller fold protein YncE
LVLTAVALTSGCAGFRERLPSERRLAKPPKFLLMWGSKGTNDGQFTSPIGIAIGPRDEVHVAEFNANRVQRFDAQGKFLARFPVLKNPGGIAVDRDGRCYVTSMTEHKLGVYDATGREVAMWGKGRSAADGEFNQPGGVVIAADGTIYVADQGNHRVQRKFGGADKPGSRFGGPQFLTIDAQGNVFTTEAAAGRIQRLSLDGQPLAQWGDNSDGPGGFGGRPKDVRNPLQGPIGVCVDRLGRVWVSATNNRVQLFTRDGKYLLGFGGDGNDPGQFHLPHAMAMNSRGHMYVVDASNQRIQKFAP